MKITERPLNYQALALEEAEGKIRVAVKDALFKGISRRALDTKVKAIITEALSSVQSEALKSASERSLKAFYTRLLQTTGRLPRSTVLTFLALSVLAEGKDASKYTERMSKTEAARIARENVPEIHSELAANYAQSVGIYHKKYMEDMISPVVNRLAKETALDPDSEGYLGERQTLRARAEREVRYETHQNRLQDFNERGVKLVIIPPHANCSERCRPFQGKVYSLDGSSGTAPDGRKYEPIENATEIFVKTKKGTVWKNGLFGFNCRHTMVEYKPGLKFPMPSAEQERREYKIDVRQRALERRVVQYKIRAEMAKGTDKDEYQKAKKKARYWDAYYRSFSKANGRAYYPSRTKTI